MKMRLSSLLSLGALLTGSLLSGCATTPQTSQDITASEPTPVILVSLDGFRTEYLSRGITPHIAAIAQSGITTTAMHPSFPSITFPNHYTLVTGLRPDHHGIVGNTMTDPAHPGVTFTMASKDSYWWDEAEPIWVTAKKQGLKVATMFWPGSESEIHGVRPDDYSAFDKGMTDDQRVNKLLSWFDVPAKDRPRFSTLYFNTTDTNGHHFGPNSPQVNDALRDVDEGVNRLMEGLASRHIKADVIVVADHGMSEIGDNQFIALDKVAPAASFNFITGGAYAGINAQPGKTKVLEAALLHKHDHMQCWRKGEIPERLHYGTNPRVPDYICLAEPGWVVLKTKPDAKHPPIKGDHGYDPASPDMNALFVASGPDFPAGKVLAPFDNVDVYPLIMQLLKVQAQPNDGTLAPFTPLLTMNPT